MGYDKREKELSDRARAAAILVADLNCAKCGRKRWNRDDDVVFVKTLHRLWPKSKDAVWTPSKWEKFYHEKYVDGNQALRKYPYVTHRE